MSGEEIVQSALHEEFNWPDIADLTLTLEQKIALGRCSNKSAFYDMVESMHRHEKNCVFCSMQFRGELIFNLPLNSWYIFVPPSDFNRHESELRLKFVMVLKRHIDDPSELRIQEAVDQLECYQFLKKQYGCFSPESGGMTYTRFGSPVWNAGTVGRHLHTNIDVPSGVVGEKGLRVPIYKEREGWEKDNTRYRHFAATYKIGMTKEEYLES